MVMHCVDVFFSGFMSMSWVYTKRIHCKNVIGSSQAVIYM